VPLTQPLLAMGVPQEVVTALDPLLRAIIETAYDRPANGGTYSATPVTLQLMPGPSQWATDIHAIAAGLAQTSAALAALNATQVSPSIAPSGSRVGQMAAATELAPPKPVEEVAKAEKQALPEKPAWSENNFLAEKHPVADVSEKTPAADPAVNIQATTQPTLTPVTPKTTTEPVKTNMIRGPIGGSPSLPGVNAITTAINGVVTGTVAAITGALTPKPAGGSTVAPAGEPAAPAGQPAASEPAA
jgi:hypothetical protein